MAKKVEPIVGLDIGNYFIKYAEVAPDSPARLLHALVLPLSSSSPEDIQKNLKAILDQIQPSSKKWRVSISGPSVLMRRIQLPVMTPAELKGAILFEAESQIPFPVNDCQLDFQILNTLPGNKTMNVLLVAAKKDFVQERLKGLSALNLVPEAIEVDVFGLVNAFELLGDDAGQKTCGLLNIGHSKSSFAILQDKMPFAMRDIAMGGADVTKQLALSKGISENEAETMKLTRNGATQEELKNATVKGFEALANEIKHSVDYFENETGEDLKNIWVSGGGAMAQDAPAVLSEELSRPVQLWDNLKKIEVAGALDKKKLSEHSPVLNVALGLALRPGKKS